MGGSRGRSRNLGRLLFSFFSGFVVSLSWLALSPASAQQTAPPQSPETNNPIPEVRTTPGAGNLPSSVFDPSSLIRQNLPAPPGLPRARTIIPDGRNPTRAPKQSRHVNPYDPEVQQYVQQLTHALPGGAGAEQAYGIIYGMVARQAMVLSYIDNFRMLAFLCLLCVPAVFLFKRVRAKRGAVAMH